MTRIKFCGLRTLDDVYAANEFFPEYGGFVFASKSKRRVTPAQADELRNALSKKIRAVTSKPIIQAFKIRSAFDVSAAEKSVADFVLVDAGSGDGKTFDWNLLKNLQREYFLAGGLNPENVGGAIELLHPFAVDVSSGIETDGRKDFVKMKSFAEIVRSMNRI